MASLGDTAEGGTNEEFSDIIKWRSGLFIFTHTFSYITEIRQLFREDKLHYCWAFAVRKLWPSQKSCCAWMTSVPMEAGELGAEQQRYGGNWRRLIVMRLLGDRESLKNVDHWQQGREEWWDGFDGATPWDTFLCSSTLLYTFEETEHCNMFNFLLVFFSVLAVHVL